MAAEVACSRGDFPVAAVVAKLAAVAGYAAAAEPTAVPAELTAAVPLVPRAAIGAKQPFKRKLPEKSKSQARKLGFSIERGVLFLGADNVKYSSRPRTVGDWFKRTVRYFVITYNLAVPFIASKFFKFDWAICGIAAVVLVQTD